MRHMIAVAVLGATLALTTTGAFADDNTSRTNISSVPASTPVVDQPAGPAMTDSTGSFVHQPYNQTRETNRGQ